MCEDNRKKIHLADADADADAGDDTDDFNRIKVSDERSLKRKKRLAWF